MKKFNLKEFNETEKITERDNYVKNRNIVLNDLKVFLLEVKQDKINYEAVISGEDYQQYTLGAVFKLIHSQENCIKFNLKGTSSHIDLKEEKAILKQMIKDTKAIVKKDYDALYSLFINPKEEP